MTLRTILLTAITTAGLLIGAGATVNQMYVSTAIIGDAGPKIGTVIFDPPFTMSRDAKGMVHVGMAIAYAMSETFPMSGMPTDGYVLMHTPAPGSMYVVIRSTHGIQDFVTGYPSGSRLVKLAAPPPGVTANDTITVVYSTLEP